jgi:hypothetical protein
MDLWPTAVSKLMYNSNPFSHFVCRWGIIADHFKAHRIVMLGTFVGSVVVRSLLLLVHSFGAIMAMVITTQVTRELTYLCSMK